LLRYVYCRSEKRQGGYYFILEAYPFKMPVTPQEIPVRVWKKYNKKPVTKSGGGDMLIRDVLKGKGDDIFKISQNSLIMEAVNTLNSKRVGALLVTDKKGDLQGIITERDILRNLGKCIEGKDIASIMTPKEKLLIAHSDDEIDFALNVFTHNKIRHLPVIDDGKIMGIISIGDTTRALMNDKEFENKSLMDYITGSYPVFDA